MASRPSLEYLPSELLLNIVSHLPLIERHDFRLVCKRLAQRLSVTAPKVKTILVDSECELKLFIEMTERGKMGCLLEQVILVQGHEEEEVYSDSDPEAEIDEHDMFNHDEDEDAEPRRPRAPHESLSIEESAKLLTHAFLNLRNNRNYPGVGVMDSILLRHRQCAQRGDGETQLFERVALALSISKLPVLAFGALGLETWDTADGVRINRWEYGVKDRRRKPFAKSDGAVSYPWFILDCEQIGFVLGKVDLGPSFKDLKELSMWFKPGSHWTNDGLSSLAKLLSWCPNLEKLHLQGRDSWSAHDVCLLQQILTLCAFQHLKTCHLSAFGITGSELINFLKTARALRSLSLEALYLEYEEWLEVFAHISTELTHLAHLRIDHIQELTETADDESRRACGKISARTSRMRVSRPIFFEDGLISDSWFGARTSRGLIDRRGEEARKLVVKLPSQTRTLNRGNPAELAHYRTRSEMLYGSLPGRRR